MGLRGGNASLSERASNVATNDPIMASVAGRYASALFELASEKNALTNVEQDLQNLQTLIDDSADLRQLLASPVLSTEQQEKALTAVLTKMGVNEMTSNFMRLVTQNRRLPVVPDVIRAFQGLAAKARGEVSAEVISATPLNEEQTSALKSALKDSVGQDVQLSAKVDPSLLGGLVVKIGSRMVDSSLRTKLATMRASLSGSA